MAGDAAGAEQGAEEGADDGSEVGKVVFMAPQHRGPAPGRPLKVTIRPRPVTNRPVPGAGRPVPGRPAPLHCAAMTEDKWLRLYLTHRRWLERAAWTALLLGSAAANTVTVNLDIRRAGLGFEPWEPAVWEFSSALVWMALIPWILRMADSRPLRWGQIRRHLPWHALFALVTSVAHVLGMVALRKLAYRAQGAFYDFGDWPLEFFYEALKDVRSYAFVLVVAGAYRLLVWRWQGKRACSPKRRDPPLNPRLNPRLDPRQNPGQNRCPSLRPNQRPSCPSACW